MESDIVMYDVNRSQAESISAYLDELGYRHTVAESARECIQKISEGCGILLLGQSEGGTSAGEVMVAAAEKNMRIICYNLFDQQIEGDALKAIKDYIRVKISL
jgi:hypothetical protein